jgi:MSHA biogenesis protein MshN
MLKDLEARRSRDLETSESLSDNIAWETNPKRKVSNGLSLIIVFILLVLFVVVGYLLWDRAYIKNLELVAVKQQEIEIAKLKNDATIKLAEIAAREKETLRAEEKAKINARIQAEAQALAKAKLRAEENIRAKEELIRAKENQARAEAKKAAADLARAETSPSPEKINPDIADSTNTVEVDNSPQVNLTKKQHPLNNKQLAEIAYNKGYQFLQQGSMHKGKEHLREALSLYIPHIRAREMLAGIYIKSGSLISAAELLSEGVKLVPEYPLFAQLYARVLLEQNKPQLAVQVLERGAEISVVDPDYYALLAASYQRISKHDKAVELYLRLVKIRPNEGVWWLGLAISLEKTGKNKQAVEAYQRAQKTGSLKSGLVKFTNNRVSALKEIGFPANE